MEANNRVTNWDFPNFKPIVLEDREIFDKVAKKFQPIADFNFNNFFAWDTEEQHALSNLNNNLALRLTDYVTGRPIYSLIGDNEIILSTKKLLEFVNKQGDDTALHLIPESIASTIKEDNDFIVEEDPSSFDYIFSIPKLASMEGREYKSKRRAAQMCSRQHKIDIEDRSIDPLVKSEILGLFNRWYASKHTEGKQSEIEYEHRAAERMLSISPNDNNVLVHIAKIDNQIVACSIDELINNGFVLSHFFKTQPEYSGLTEYFNQSLAIILSNSGQKFWNWQQDLGIENLRRMKLSYRPKSIHKQYIVRLK